MKGMGFFSNIFFRACPRVRWAWWGGTGGGPALGACYFSVLRPTRGEFSWRDTLLGLAPQGIYGKEFAQKKLAFAAF